MATDWHEVLQQLPREDAARITKVRRCARHDVVVGRHPSTQEAQRRAAARQDLTLFRRPRATLRHVAAFVQESLLHGAAWVVKHPATLFIILPLLVAYAVLKVEY